jgi:hypothetical protein
MQPHVTALKTDRKEWAPQQLLEQWRQHLQGRDRSAGTIIKYTQAVASFCVWYEQEEQVPLQLSTLTPIALIGYRNELQHEQHKSISTINLHQGVTVLGDQEVALSKGVIAQEECNLALHIGPGKTLRHKVKRNVQAGFHW